MFIYGIVHDWREVDLKSLLKEKNIDVRNPKLVINKIDYKLHFYVDTILVKTYDVVFGDNPRYKKRTKRDKYTPVGEYYICEKKSNTSLGKAMLLSYPNIVDAEAGLKTGLINQQEFEAISHAIKNFLKPPMNTALGGEIYIHGNGSYDVILRNLPFIINWTDGSIALNNSEIEELYDVCSIGTKVIIY
ncbi:MAG: L,D-transpeptidase [Ignavibacteria bacterium]|nr:L,D-transpeptidase [Ignavibacteria bacterium]